MIVEPPVESVSIPQIPLSSTSGCFNWILCDRRVSHSSSSTHSGSPDTLQYSVSDEIVVSDDEDDASPFNQTPIDSDVVINVSSLKLSHEVETSTGIDSGCEDPALMKQLTQTTLRQKSTLLSNMCISPSILNYISIRTCLETNRFIGLHDTSDVILNSTDFLQFVLESSTRLNDQLVKSESTMSDSSSSSSSSTPAESSDDIRQTPVRLTRSPSTLASLPPIILIPGGGIFFFWKAGFATYLAKHFDTSRCIFVGTSAGALASFLAIASDNIAKASRLAIKLAMEKNVWEKTAFLAGVLQQLVSTWLEKVVPKNLDLELLRHRLLVIAYRISRIRLECFCRFQSREDLIDCLLASVHIPFYANGKAATKVRGVRYLDGSFGPDIMKTFASEIPAEKIVLVRCCESDYVTPIPRKECLRKHSPAVLLDLFRQGFAFAEKLHRQQLLVPLMPFEMHPPGMFDISDDPHLDADRINDESLDDSP